MRYEYACRTDDRIEHAKRVIAERASRQGNSIVGYKIERTSSHPRLQEMDHTAGREFAIVVGVTTQAELSDGAADATPR